MSSLYAQYIKERLNRESIESDYGFMTYSVIYTSLGSQFFIHDFFIVPEFRHSGKGLELVKKATEIAKSLGCTHAMSTVDPSANCATESLVMQIKFDMQIVGTNGGLIYLKKEL